MHLPPTCGYVDEVANENCREVHADSPIEIQRGIMNEYLQFKRKVQERVEALEKIIGDLERHGLVDAAAAARWKKHLGQVESSLQDSLLRIAVVGSVKSGKSTLINALAGNDLLKRGPGIITAFITRIVTGGEIGGWIELKTWAQALDELNAALRMLPVFQEEAEDAASVDIRVEADRQRLKFRLEQMQTEWLQDKGNLDSNFMLLKGFLDGYSGLHGSLGDQVSRLILDEHSLSQHQRYVGHEGRSVYVRDVELRYPFAWLGENVEIADCQGSDSPNPAHYELLQQYMLKSHFILYVISGRTGLREADFRLIDFIKTLRMFPQTLFVLNTDMDVHTSAEDLDRLAERVRTELNWVVPNPRFFSFSALYQLLETMGEAAPGRERRRLELWKEDEALVKATEAGFGAFREHLGGLIVQQRSRILLGSGLSRLSMVAASVVDTIRVRKQLADHGIGAVRESAGKIKSRRMALQGSLVTLANAISGLNDSLRRELGEAIDRYFDPRDGQIVKDTLGVVENYPVDARYRKDLGDYRQVLRELYHFYLEFRQSLARYLVERVNLRVIEFAKEEESSLRDCLTRSTRAFWSLFSTAVADYRRDLLPFQIEARSDSEACETEWSCIEDILPPAFSAFMDRDAVGRGVLLMKFGMGRFARLVKNIKTRAAKPQDFFKWDAQKDDTIDEAVRLVKSEARAELLRAFRDYAGNFKTGYLFRMLDEATLHLIGEFRTRAEMAQLDFADMARQSELEGEGRQAAAEVLNRSGAVAEAMVEELDELRCAVNPGSAPHGEEASPPEQERSEPAPI